MGAWTEFVKIYKDFMRNSTFHGAKFLVNDEYSYLEKYKEGTSIGMCSVVINRPLLGSSGSSVSLSPGLRPSFLSELRWVKSCHLLSNLTVRYTFYG